MAFSCPSSRPLMTMEAGRLATVMLQVALTPSMPSASTVTLTEPGATAVTVSPSMVSTAASSSESSLQMKVASPSGSSAGSKVCFSPA